MSLTASTSGCIRPSFKLSKLEGGVGGKLHSAKAKPYFSEVKFVNAVTAGGSVKFLHFHSFFVFFLTKTIEIR